MNILSINFLGFVVATLAGYYLIAVLQPRIAIPNRVTLHTRTFQNLLLLCASYYFYSTWSKHFTYVLAAYTLLNFAFGLWLHRSANYKKAILWLGILLNISGLAWYAVGGFALKTGDIPPETKMALFAIIIMPVGMSYFTLNGISYLVDISLRIAKPTTNLIDFGLYLAYFPKLISGPLERARKFLPMLAEPRVVDNAAIGQSLTLILVGLLRAAILGGIFSLFQPGKPLGDPATYGNITLVWAMLSYMFYLYNQFAGYTDIVRGVSGLFGIPLTRNFMQPFFSRDFSDFWQRWHISLSSWLRDYIYMPISRAFLRRNPSRTNIPNLIIPPLVTMLVSGLWHSTTQGVKPNLLIWGFLMGLFIVVENVRMLFRPAVPRTSATMWQKIGSTGSLLVLMLIATAPFQMDIKTCILYYRQLLLGWQWTGISLIPAVVIAVSLLADWFQAKSKDEIIFLKWPVWLQVALMVSITMGVIIVQQLQSAPPVFVYP